MYKKTKSKGKFCCERKEGSWYASPIRIRLSVAKSWDFREARVIDYIIKYSGKSRGTECRENKKRNQ